jgi:peptidoglycan hydrolase-like protein with peptidoglycan-binding domain
MFWVQFSASRSVKNNKTLEIYVMKKIFILVVSLFVLCSGAFAQNASMTTTTAAVKTSDTKPKRGPVFRPTKDQIKQIQQILIDKKLYSGEANGTYNDPTRDGIKSFQKDNGLKQTGTLNRATLEKFGVTLTDAQKAIPVSPSSYETAPSSTTTPAKSTSETPKKTIFRATKDQITAAQKVLKDKSFYSGEANGKLDDPTRDGLKKYQDANGLKVTGTLNQVTLEKMGIALTDSQKAADAAAK